MFTALPCSYKSLVLCAGGVSSTVISESALRSAGTLLPRVRAPPSAPRPDGGPQSPRSLCCGQTIYTNQTPCSLYTFCSSILISEDTSNGDNIFPYYTRR
ncbi:hypothetical protein PoB_005701200 [Plakobranchus ocellatus]|uniref:Uncharacterized protein n=1 Tax=Plakobranchus ocellatus TaxID=259542 RepID=A0AAV4CFY0_9GAST|nr:hypothetical protein PoB_005701200 [Plakobranchus ocellatus]